MKFINLALCLGLAGSGAAALAAPLFGPPNPPEFFTNRVSDCTPGGATGLSGSVASNVVNGGAGVVLSGSATSTTAGSRCVSFEWNGPMTGALGAQPTIPIAWDFTIDIQAAEVGSITGSLSITFYHESYLSGNFNQGGYGLSAAIDGPGNKTSFPNTVLQWPGPTDGSVKNFQSYSVQLIVDYATNGTTEDTLTISIPQASSIDLGYLQGGPVQTQVPEPVSMSLIAIGLTGFATLRFARRRQVRR